MGYELRDYACPEHGRHESLETRPAPEVIECPACGQPSAKVISAPRVKVKMVEPVSRMSSGERPPGCIDTRPLAEGMTMGEWKASRRKEQARQSWAELRNAGVL